MTLHLTTGHLMGICETCDGPMTSKEFDSDECRDAADDFFLEMTCVANSRHKFRYRVFPEIEAERVDYTPKSNLEER